MEAFDSLRADVARNAAAKGCPPEIKKYMQDTVWPFMEALVDTCDEQVGELADTVDEIIEGSEELLHGDTAAALIEELTLGATLAAELKSRLAPGDPLHEQIALYGQGMTELIQRIGEITIDDGEVDEDAPADGTEEAEEPDVDGE